MGRVKSMSSVPRRILASFAIFLLGALVTACSSGHQPTLGADRPNSLRDIVRAAESRAAGLLPGLDFEEINCSTQERPGGPPLCAPDEPDRTRVQVFPFADCGQEWLRHGEMEQRLKDLPRLQFVAAYRQAESEVLVFAHDVRDIKPGFAVFVREGRIYTISAACGSTPIQIITQLDLTDRLPHPLTPTPGQ
jgi:hypothetical protein